MVDTLSKKREVRVGDKIMCWAGEFLTRATVTKVTTKYIWLESILRVSWEPFSIKRHRQIVLRDTDYY